MTIVRVALDIPLPRLFDYSVKEPVAVGQRVAVPFGRQILAGVILEVAAESDMAPERIKPVTQVMREEPLVSAELLGLLRFCSDYYHHPVGQTVHTALPAPLRAARSLARRKEAVVYELSARGQALDPDTFPARKVVQRRILSRLKDGPCTLVQIRALSATAGVQVNVLEQEGWIARSTSIPLQGDEDGKQYAFDNAHVLTTEQQQAVAAVMQSSGYQCFLLHGITGSGKTEVYVHLMHQVLQHGGQTLLLVPEINLTPQLEQYFRSRFPDVPIVSLHSGLSEGERLHNW